MNYIHHKLKVMLTLVGSLVQHLIWWKTWVLVLFTDMESRVGNFNFQSDYGDYKLLISPSLLPWDVTCESVSGFSYKLTYHKIPKLKLSCINQNDNLFYLILQKICLQMNTWSCWNSQVNNMFSQHLGIQIKHELYSLGSRYTAVLRKWLTAAYLWLMGFFLWRVF